jgi:selenoprotein W-related protein
MAEKILGEFGRQINELTLIPSDGGRYEVSLNGNLVFSKLQENRFPEVDEIMNMIRSSL